MSQEQAHKDAVIKKRQQDCKRHPESNISTPGCPTQCGFCGMSLADQEAYAAEQSAWSQWAGGANQATQQQNASNKAWPGTPVGHPSLNPLSNNNCQPVNLSPQKLIGDLEKMRDSISSLPVNTSWSQLKSTGDADVNPLSDKTDFPLFTITNLSTCAVLGISTESIDELLSQVRKFVAPHLRVPAKDLSKYLTPPHAWFLKDCLLEEQQVVRRVPAEYSDWAPKPGNFT